MPKKSSLKVPYSNAYLCITTKTKGLTSISQKTPLKKEEQKALILLFAMTNI